MYNFQLWPSIDIAFSFVFLCRLLPSFRCIHSKYLLNYSSKEKKSFVDEFIRRTSTFTRSQKFKFVGTKERKQILVLENEKTNKH